MWSKVSFLKKYARAFNMAFYICDIFLISFSWLISYYISLATISISQPYLIALPIVVILTTFFFEYFGIYMPQRMKSLATEFFNITKALSITTLLLFITSFFTKYYLFSRLSLIIFCTLSVATLTTSHLILRLLLRHFRKKGYNHIKIIIVGASDLGRECLKRIKNNAWMGFDVVGFVDDKTTLNQRIDDVPVIGKLKEISNIIHIYKAKQVFITLPIRAYHKVDTLINNLIDHAVIIHFIPQMQHLLIRSNIQNFDGLPIITLMDHPIQGMKAVMKRCFDILFSLCALLITSPLYIIIPIIIKLESEGEVFFRQERIGRNGKIFKLIKFRTMKINSYYDITRKNDPRITKIGKILRRFSLDEFPQFINVLKGEMAVVGPRPHMLDEYYETKQKIPAYATARQYLKPGITGWAQLKGYRSGTEKLSLLEERIKYDLYYIENWSLVLDFKIILFTLVKGFLNRSE